MSGKVRVTETGLRHITSLKNDLEQQKKQIEEARRSEAAKSKSEMSSKLVKLIGSFGAALHQKYATPSEKEATQRTVLPFASPRYRHSKIGFLTENHDVMASHQPAVTIATKNSPYQTEGRPSKDSIHSIMNLPTQTQTQKNLPSRGGLDSSRKLMITAASPTPSQADLHTGASLPVPRRMSLLRLQPRPSILRGVANPSGDAAPLGTHAKLPGLHAGKTPRHAPLFFVPPQASPAWGLGFVNSHKFPVSAIDTAYPAELKAQRAETKRQKVSRLAEMSELKFERRQQRLHIVWRKEKQERGEPETFRSQMDSLVKSMESERNSFEQHSLERESHVQRVKEFKKKTSLAGMHAVKLHRWQVMLPAKFFGARSADTSVATNRPGPGSNRPH